MSDNQLILPCDVGDVSDGYHTFNELYDHRCVLFLAFLTLMNNGWYSERHHDGSQLDGWFIAGVEISGVKRDEGQEVTYHLPNKYLRIASQRLRHLECAPAWDGHTSADVLTRIENWIDSGSYIPDLDWEKYE